MSATVVLFACVHNAGRSQMAAAFFNRMADPEKARAISAGTEPGDRVHPEVVGVMREVGIDLDHIRPRRLTDDVAKSVQWLITMGCGESCPFIPGALRDDWPIPDPKGQALERVREIREELSSRVDRFIRAMGWFKSAD